MDLNDVAATLQNTNPEMAQVVETFNQNFQANVQQIQTLQKDVKTAVEKRDGLKTLVRNATGLNDLTEESLSNFLSSKGDEQSGILRKEVEELQLKLGETTGSIDQVRNEYEQKIFGLKLDRAVNMLGAQDEVHSPHAYNVILDELSRGATFENDEIVYKNEDGSSVFTHDGSTAGIKSRYEDMKADERFSYLFKDQYKSGGGKPAGPTGPTMDAGGAALKRSTLSDADKVTYIAKHGMGAYKALPM